MSQWNREQSYNNSCQSFANFYRYPPPHSNEHRMSNPRGVNTPFNRPHAVGQPPPVRPRLPIPFPPVGPAEGRLPQLPPFLRHMPPPPPPYPPPPPDRYRNPNPCTTSPFRGIPGPFSMPPPQNGHHSLAQNFHHVQGRFPPNRPPVNYPNLNVPPPNCPPPFPPHPAARLNAGVCHALRPVNTFCQRPSGLPIGNQQKGGLQMKRRLDNGFNGGKVYVMGVLLLHAK